MADRGWGAGGWWRGRDPTLLATPEAFAANPALVSGWSDTRRLAAPAAQPNAAWKAPEEALSWCDPLLVVGTSSLVFPAAGWVERAAAAGAATVDHAASGAGPSAPGGPRGGDGHMEDRGRGTAGARQRVVESER
jgi:NAD-dependent deacetylase